MGTKKVTAPKYPRIMVSPERHIELQKEAEAKGTTLMDIAERKFKKAR